MVIQSTADDAGLLEVIDTSATLHLHRSNLLRLQITELLEECQLDLENPRWNMTTQEYFQHLSSIIAGVSVVVRDFQDLADKPVSVELRPGEQGKLSLEPIGCSKARLGWTKKAGNAQVLPTFDYMVRVPPKVFSGKDYMHYRYFDKRSLIMKKVAETLSTRAAKIGTIKFVWIHGTNRPPLLLLQPPKAKNAPKFQVHLHFGMESIQWIPRLRLVPNRTNIKENGQKSQFYNHCLMYDARHIFEDAHIQELLEYRSCQEALVLLQVWALQRGLWRNHDGWDKTSVALLMLYLLRTSKMNPRMTPIQQFTIVLQTWATTNWLGEKEHKNQSFRAAQGQDTPTQVNVKKYRTVLVLPEDGESESETVRAAELSNLYARQTEESPLSTDDPRTLIEAYALTDCYHLGPVFMDPSMSYNYLGGVSSNYMKLLSLHARKSLEALKNSRSAFHILFIQGARFWQQWDLYVRVATTCKSPAEDWEFTVRHLLQKLELGLGNRVYGMRILSNGNGELLGGTSGTDLYFEEPVNNQKEMSKLRSRSPIGTDDIIIGVSINQETSQRVVDRGPPPEQHTDVQHFIDLWGDKAQLRRFKDGAIVQAVVWNGDRDQSFYNGDKWNGDSVQKIIRHLLRVHHTTAKLAFSFPIFLSTIDGVLVQDDTLPPNCDPLLAHQRVKKAFEGLSDFLLRHTEQPTPGQTSSLGLPLSIDAVEPLSSTLRYSELFPPFPHPLLGGSPTAEKRVSGAIMFDPILVQIRFGASSKWPTDLKAIGAAKTAMLVQLGNGIKKIGDKDFDGVIYVCPTYAEIGYRGYCFRIIVRADPEIHMLQRLLNPSPAASQLLKDLSQKHQIASLHHSSIHAVHTLHPSAASVVRLVRRWAASHLLSGHVTTEMIELLVASVYTDDGIYVQPPATVCAGFLRFLQLLATFDWGREPLIVNPRGHISVEEYDEIYQDFEKCRGKGGDGGPPMYVIAAYNRDTIELDAQQDLKGVSTRSAGNKPWRPSVASPEWVVLSRAVYLAKRSRECMLTCLSKFDDDGWRSIFHECPNSFKSYSVLMRVGGDFVVDRETSSTSGNLKVTRNSDGLLQSSFARSMEARIMGPKCLRQKVYRNLRGEKSTTPIPVWHPIEDLVKSLQKRFGDYAVFFYNEFCPEVIGIVWRPQVFVPGSFSAISSEHGCPVGDDWKADTLISRNASDLLRDMTQYTSNVVTSVRIFDETCLAHFHKKQKMST